jgi:hypothetical protein
MAASEWMRWVRAIRDTLVADYSAPGVNTTHRAARRPPIAFSPFLLTLSVSYFQLILGLCGQLLLVLAMGPVLDPAGFIGLRGNGLTPLKIGDLLSEPSL